jgi:hypothetical protein
MFEASIFCKQIQCLLNENLSSLKPCYKTGLLPKVSLIGSQVSHEFNFVWFGLNWLLFDVSNIFLSTGILLIIFFNHGTEALIVFYHVVRLLLNPFYYFRRVTNYGLRGATFRSFVGWRAIVDGLVLHHFGRLVVFLHASILFGDTF